MDISFKTEKKKPNEKHNILMSQLYERVDTILYILYYYYIHSVRNTGNYRRVMVDAAHKHIRIFLHTRATVYFHFIIIINYNRLSALS